MAVETFVHCFLCFRWVVRIRPSSESRRLNHQVRRSWLLVPVSKEKEIQSAHDTGADVVVLDLVEFVSEVDKPAAREKVGSAIDRVKQGGAEVFAQVDPELLYADLRACVWPGLTGVVIAGLETPRQVTEAHDLLGRLEEERGIQPHSLEIIGALETARGNLQGYEIGLSSPRVWGLTLGRADLVMDLRPEPSGEIHLMQYLMQRLIIMANAAGAVPLGAWWQEPDRGLAATPENTYRAAFKGRAIGFKGSFCVKKNQVAPLNGGFCPTDVEVAAARDLLKAYERGVAQGAAALHWEDRIIDAGVAEQARSLIDLADACAARDEAKAAALERRPEPKP